VKVWIKCSVICALLVFIVSGCARQDEKNKRNTAGSGLRIVITLFPLYDFSRAIIGDKGTVVMLVPPGMEPHSFEPRPDDVARISKSSLFIYTNRYMEPWADRIVKGIASPQLVVVNAGEGLTYLESTGNAHEKHDHAEEHKHRQSAVYDPHVWLDFGNAVKMVANITQAITAADPGNRQYYENNAAALKKRLEDMDKRYSKGLADCSSRLVMHGGHYAFGYMAHRYKLDYRSLSGVSSESEPSAAKMAKMVRQIKASGVRYLFAEEMLSPRISETIAAETGASVLRLHGAHNIAVDEYNKGTTFFDLMDVNLKMLQKGLGCSEK